MITDRDARYVENFIHTSPKANLLLLRTNKHSKLVLHLAACKKYPTVTKLLLNYRAKPNA